MLTIVVILELGIQNQNRVGFHSQGHMDTAGSWTQLQLNPEQSLQVEGSVKCSWLSGLSKPSVLYSLGLAFHSPASLRVRGEGVLLPATGLD